MSRRPSSCAPESLNNKCLQMLQTMQCEYQQNCVTVGPSGSAVGRCVLQPEVAQQSECTKIVNVLCPCACAPAPAVMQAATVQSFALSCFGEYVVQKESRCCRRCPTRPAFRCFIWFLPLDDDTAEPPRLQWSPERKAAGNGKLATVQKVAGKKVGMNGWVM